VNAVSPLSTGSAILDDGRSPHEWVEILSARGITISERALRERANKLHACHRLGRAMIITPAQMDLILEGGEKCRSNPISEAKPGGLEAASNISAGPSAGTTAAALARLTQLAQRGGARPRKIGGSVVTFSATKPRSRSQTQ
jgi:hypothetical protein